MDDKSKSDLIADLNARGIFSKGTLPQLKARCEAAQIPLMKEVDNITQEGFIGQSKGMFQILLERGFINPDPSTWKNYTLDGTKNERGQLDEKTSLRYLMELLPDFANEKTLLHHHGEELGCIIFNSPKCTPEVAEEGIEFDWVISKQ